MPLSQELVGLSCGPSKQFVKSPICHSQAGTIVEIVQIQPERSVWLYFKQIPQLVDIARAFPDLPIVLNHLGAPLGVGPYSGKRDEVFKTWSEAMKALAACPNVHMKLGGLAMVVMGFDFHKQATPPSSQTLAQAWGPYLQKAIELFGAQRCMFESNFPVDKAMCSYAVLWNAFKRVAAGASATEKASLFRETANSFYRLGIKS